MMFRRHPFAVLATLEHSVVLTFSVDHGELEPWVPAPLSVDRFNTLGFVAVAMVKVRALRPAPLSSRWGGDFFLLGYRIFVRYRSTAGGRMRGLYILGSDTDSWRMKVLGDLLTTYRYRKTDVCWQSTSDRTEVRSERSGLTVVAHEVESPQLPKDSPFSTWAEARRYAGPMPHTFAVHAQRRRVVIVTGRRQQWRPRPLTIERGDSAFVESLGFKSLRLASAFAVHDVPYRWERGRQERWLAE